MSELAFWVRTFPIATIVVCLVLLVVIRKFFTKDGPDSSSKWLYIVVFVMLVASIGVAAWGFKHVKPPLPKGTWK